MRFFIAVAIGALLSLPAHAQRTIRVPAEAPTIQAAINMAQAGDTVLLADGVYRGPGNKSLTMRPIDITLRSEGGAGACIIDMEGDGRAMHFYQGQTAGYVVEGITFRNGRQGDKAGAIWIRGASPTIRDCVFEDCWSVNGGAIYMENAAAPTITGCAFLRNGSCYSDARGGAIFIDNAAPNLVACYFEGNVTSESVSFAGAAIYAIGDRYELDTVVSLERCHFEGHRSTRHGYSTISSHGLYCRLIARDCAVLESTLACATDRDVMITDSHFERCDRVLWASDEWHPYLDSLLASCDFRENQEVVTGAIFLGRFDDCRFTGGATAQGTFSRCSFISATGPLRGTLLSCIIRGSSIRFSGNAVNSLFHNNMGPLFSNSTATNCTIYGNQGSPSIAEAQATIFCDKFGCYPRPGGVRLTNCVLDENQPPLIEARGLIFEGEEVGSTVIIEHSVVPTGTAGIALDPLSSFEWGAGNLLAPPRFVDAAAGDLRLAEGSPAIDAGDNAAWPSSSGDLDLAGEPRHRDDVGTPDIGLSDPARPGFPIIDIGAYEFQGESPCRADLDGDGELTFFDFIVFQDLFAAGDPLADFDFDGELTFFDFLEFQEGFAAGCA